MGRSSPTCQIFAPLAVIFYVPAKDVLSGTGRFVGNMEEVQARFIQGSTSLMVITGRASRNDVVPDMFAAQVTG